MSARKWKTLRSKKLGILLWDGFSKESDRKSTKRNMNPSVKLLHLERSPLSEIPTHNGPSPHLQIKLTLSARNDKSRICPMRLPRVPFGCISSYESDLQTNWWFPFGFPNHLPNGGYQLKQRRAAHFAGTPTRVPKSNCSGHAPQNEMNVGVLLVDQCHQFLPKLT